MRLNKESLAGQIKEELKERIVNLRISPGEKIDVAGLEKEFNVSRAPVREALQGLSDQGLVEVKPRVGYFAVELEPSQVKDICELRKLFETFALQHSINDIPEGELTELLRESRGLKEEFQENEQPKESLRSRFDRIDDRIHQIIIENSGNEYLKDFTERIHNLIALTRHLNKRMEVANKEHLRLLEGILDRDLQTAREHLREHLDNVESVIIDSVEDRVPSS